MNARGKHIHTVDRLIYFVVVVGFSSYFLSLRL